MKKPPREEGKDMTESATQQRCVDLNKKILRQEGRFRKILKKIIDYDEPDSLEYIRRLSTEALKSTHEGSIGWFFTSAILDNPRIKAFCKLCSISCYGDPATPEIWPCHVRGCPFERSRKKRS